MVRDQVPRQDAAQRAGAAEDEHRTVGAERSRPGAVGELARQPGEARDEQMPVVERELGLGRIDRQREQRSTRRLAVIEIENGDRRVRVLRLRRPRQSPDRRVDQVAHAMVGVRGDRATGDQDEAGGSEAVVGEPVLEQREGATRGAMYGGHQVRRFVPGHEGDQDHIGARAALRDRHPERREIGIAHDRPAGRHRRRQREVVADQGPADRGGRSGRGAAGALRPRDAEQRLVV